jgi:hypothetical protein
MGNPIYLIIVIAVIGAGIFLWLNRKKKWARDIEDKLKSATFQKVGYDRIEPVMPNQPEKLPQAYKTPKGAVVHSDTPPTALALELIDKGISRAIAAGFKDNPNMHPPDAHKNWTKFRTHAEYRFWLYETAERSATPETLGVPILLSHHGYVAGITAGFMEINRKIEDVFPFTIMPKLTDTRPIALKTFEDTVYNECEHWITANDTPVFFYYKGANDYHPIFPV